MGVALEMEHLALEPTTSGSASSGTTASTCIEEPTGANAELQTFNKPTAVATHKGSSGP